jgi:tetratricopeptide (TPR) repeat protein
MVMRSSSSLLPRFSHAVLEECDPVLAEQAMPANLKLLEGLLKSDPQNPALLHSLCMGFCGYSLLFVEEKDPRRAAALFLRARNYGLQALGKQGLLLADLKTGDQEIRSILRSLDKIKMDSLVWATAAWINWINLNLDRPEALAQIGLAETCLKQCLETDDQYLYGLPNLLMGSTLAGRPALLGGDLQRSKVYFEKAMAGSQGRFLLTYYYFARYYAVQTQDKELFLNLIQKAAAADPQDLKEMCLINTVFQRKIIALKEKMDDFF